VLRNRFRGLSASEARSWYVSRPSLPVLAFSTPSLLSCISLASVWSDRAAGPARTQVLCHEHRFGRTAHRRMPIATGIACTCEMQGMQQGQWQCGWWHWRIPTPSRVTTLLYQELDINSHENSPGDDDYDTRVVQQLGEVGGS
jgi:hypothetical protein